MSGTLPTLSPLAQAIAQAEGFFSSSANIPNTINNPGDLTSTSVNGAGFGTTVAKGGILVNNYPDLETGAAALESKINNILAGNSTSYSPNMSLQQFGNVYSGNNAAYGQTLANSLGVPASTTLAQLQQQGLAGTGSAVSSSGAAAASTSPSAASTAATAASSAAKSATLSTATLLAQIEAFGLSRVILLILGIILFGAGLFAFKQTQTVIKTASKGAAKLGALTA